MKYDLETASRRLDAYIEMLKVAYQVDEYGLADMLGIHRGTWTKFRRADFESKGIWKTFELADLTGISIDWLLNVSD